MNLVSSTPARRQRGLSLFGMLFWAVIIGGGALVLMKVYPSVQKYLTTREAVNRVMRSDPRPNTVPAIRLAFNRQRSIEYISDMIKGEDLDVEATGDGFRVGFAYDEEVELVAPVFLLIKYRYTASAK